MLIHEVEWCNFASSPRHVPQHACDLLRQQCTKPRHDAMGSTRTLTHSTLAALTRIVLMAAGSRGGLAAETLLARCEDAGLLRTTDHGRWRGQRLFVGVLATAGPAQRQGDAHPDAAVQARPGTSSQPAHCSATLQQRRSTDTGWLC
jgi:hypothetical protein